MRSGGGGRSVDRLDNAMKCDQISATFNITLRTDLAHIWHCPPVIETVRCVPLYRTPNDYTLLTQKASPHGRRTKATTKHSNFFMTQRPLSHQFYVYVVWPVADSIQTGFYGAKLCLIMRFGSNPVEANKPPNPTFLPNSYTCLHSPYYPQSHTRAPLSPSHLPRTDPSSPGKVSL